MQSKMELKKEMDTQTEKQGSTRSTGCSDNNWVHIYDALKKAMESWTFVVAEVKDANQDR